MNFRIHSPATRPMPQKPRATAPIRAPQPPESAVRQTRPLATREFQPSGPSGAPVDLEALAEYRALRDQGKLTPGVLEQLRALATRPLAPGIDRKTLLVTALQEIADPERIGQGDRHTCAAAVVQAKLAQDDPAEYLRLLSGLASPEGEVTVANGEIMRRDPYWQLAAGRSLTGDLMQPAFMQVATGSYDSRTDTRATADGRGKGLYAAEQTRLLDAVSGVRTATVFGNGPEVLGTIGQALARGHSIPVVLSIRDRETGQMQGHSVLVEAIKDGQVTFLDPKGRRRTVSLEAFTSRLQSASLPEMLVPRALLEASEGKQGVLAGWDLWGTITGGAKAIGDAFTEHVAKPVVNAFAGAAQAVHEHVVQPVANTVGQVGAAIQEHVLQPIAEKVGPVAGWLATNIFVPLFEHVIAPTWEFIRNSARELEKYIRENQEFLRSIAAIAFAVTPGLNVLSLVLAAGDMIDGLKSIAEGIQKGDWKLALKGVGLFCGAAALALGGPILSAALGKGAVALARLATGVSKLAQATSAFMDVCDEKLDPATRFGRLMSGIVQTVGGRAMVLGEEAEKAAAGFVATAEKAQGYYDRSVNLYKALLGGEANWQDGLSQGLGLVASAQGDLRQNDAASRRLGHQINEGVYVLNQAPTVYQAMTRPAGQAPSKDQPTDVDAIAGFLSLGGRIAHDVRTDWSPDTPQPVADKHLLDPTAHLAELWRESKGLTAGTPQAQVQAAWDYFKKAGKTQSDDQATQWLRKWTTELESWASDKGEAAKTWATSQIQEAWKWWSEQRPAVPAS